MLRAEVRTPLGPGAALDAALEAGPGECLAVAGLSGAGKSSLLRVVAGLLRPREGVVRCGGETWTDTAARVHVEPEHRRCGVVFQDYALFGHLSAWRNVAYGLRGLPRAQRRARAVELLARFGLEDRAEARPATLSGGERQRVALARALAVEPAALLLDEPLSALDARTRRDAAAELGHVLREVAVPALLVTHDFEEAAQLADRVAVLDAGRVVQVGTATELAAAPATPFVAGFTGAVVLRGVARGAAGGLTAVALDGGGEVLSAEGARGPVAVAVHPWEVSLEPPGSGAAGSGRNRLAVEVRSVTEIGNRARVGLAAPQSLVAEVTVAAARELRLRPGDRVVATFKATATRLLPG